MFDEFSIFPTLEERSVLEQCSVGTAQCLEELLKLKADLCKPPSFQSSSFPPTAASAYPCCS